MRWLPLAAVVALLAAAMLAAAYANPTIDRVPTGLFGSEQAAEDGPTPAAPDATRAGSLPAEDGVVVPSWVGWVFTVLCSAGVLFVLGLLLWLQLRERLPGLRRRLTVEESEPPTPTETARRVRRALDEGLAGLDGSDADPRRVVIECWVRLEEAAAAAGIVRAAGETTTDLVGRMLAHTQVSPGVLDAFAAVYREARFATHVVDAAMRDQARAALTQLRDELALGVS